MKTICDFIYLGAMTELALSDLYFRKISENELLYLLTSGIGCYVLRSPAGRLRSLIFALFLYAFFFLCYGFLSKGIGGGDLKVLTVCVLSLGLGKTLRLFLSAVLFSGLYALGFVIFLLLQKVRIFIRKPEHHLRETDPDPSCSENRQSSKKGRQTLSLTFPFLPFLWLGALLCFTFRP